MQLSWKTVEGTQQEQPKEVDTTSSPLTVYLRKDITRVEKEQNGETIQVWHYQEAVLTIPEYVQYQKELAECDSLSQKELLESNLVVMGALADSFEQLLTLQENQLTLMEAIADVFENTVTS